MTWDRRRGLGLAPATAGELLQGVIHDSDFMITFPITVQVEAEVTGSATPGVTIWPPGKTKAMRAAGHLLSSLGRADVGCHVVVRSPLPEGRGFASSSADIVATCRAVADFVDAPVRASQLAAIACAIEASDAVMYDHPVAFDFMRGRVLIDPGRRLPVLAVAVDVGDPVDTVSFTRVPYSAAERTLVQRAFDLAVAGLRRGDLPAVAAAATVSARVNQRRQAKPHLELLVQICVANGGHGVSVAHSGTVAVMLFDEWNVEGARQAAAQAVAAVPGAWISHLTAASEKLATAAPKPVWPRVTG